jgi:putative oxidoreductase
VAAFFGHENLNSHQSVLLGLIFLVFGLNGFLHFIPMPPPSGVAGQFLGSMFVTKYLLFVFAIQLIGGVLLLINRYVPLALTILAPIIVNILLYHVLMNPTGLGLAFFVTVLCGVVFASVRLAFAGIFEARVETKTSEVRAGKHVLFHQPNYEIN